MGTFFTSDTNKEAIAVQDDEEPVLAIEASPATAELMNREKANTSQTFFVTLQDANMRKSGDPDAKAEELIHQSLSQEQSLTHTLCASENNLDSPKMQQAIDARKSTENNEQQSKELDDEVNQLNCDADQDIVHPLNQAASNGNLNVQTLIEQSKNLNGGQTRSGRPVRPQSSRPMFRQNFQTLDPSRSGLGGGMGVRSREPHQFSGFNMIPETNIDTEQK